MSLNHELVIVGPTEEGGGFRIVRVLGDPTGPSEPSVVASTRMSGMRDDALAALRGAGLNPVDMEDLGGTPF